MFAHGMTSSGKWPRKLPMQYSLTCFISGNPSSKKGTPLMPNQTETHRIHRRPSARRGASMICLFIVGLLLAHAEKLDARAETRRTADSESPNAPADLERRVEALEAEVAELKRLLTANSPAASAS